MLTSFYDQLSPFYKYIFQDWNASVRRQAIILEEVIAETVLSSSCDQNLPLQCVVD